uniref:glycosyltransferase n=1 Tax=Ningiella ruwaisensis TaxID=2364274 RepID=UPI00109FAD09|nr:glycosyltransferase [Ningiella ruwaisensis]
MSKPFELVSDVQDDADVSSVVALSLYEKDNSVWALQAIESILNQTYTDFLLIVVIDGPIDNEMRSLLKDKADHTHNFMLVEMEENSGLSVCMNSAINLVLQRFKSIEYFFRMDSDDKSLPDRLSKQVLFFKRHPEISILGTSLVEINEKGRIVGRRILPEKHESILKLLPRRCPINHPTVGIRMSVFEQGFRYRDDLRNTQDYYLWIDLMVEGFKFANLQETLLQFRRVKNFYKRRGIKKSFNEFSARIHAMKKLQKMNASNLFYAIAVLGLRMMPSKIVKLAYKVDRYSSKDKV